VSPRATCCCLLMPTAGDDGLAPPAKSHSGRALEKCLGVDRPRRTTKFGPPASRGVCFIRDRLRTLAMGRRRCFRSDSLSPPIRFEGAPRLTYDVLVVIGRARACITCAQYESALDGCIPLLVEPPLEQCGLFYRQLSPRYSPCPQPERMGTPSVSFDLFHLSRLSDLSHEK
jgi:hypothetical protein